VESALQDLKTSEAGLAQTEAEKRLLENGRNELAKAKKKSLIARVAEQILNPMVLMLLAAAIISVILATL
jgi:Ca2+-transporting ATPase